MQLDPEFVRGYQRLATFLIFSLDHDTFHDDWKKPGDYTMDNNDDNESDDDDDDNNTNTNKSNNNNKKNNETETAPVRVTKIRRELETVSRRGLRLDPANEALLEALQVLRDLDCDNHDTTTPTFALNVQLAPTDVDLSLSEGASARSKIHKTAGATAFQQKNWTVAEKFYTKALACDPVSVAVVITAAEANAMPMGEGHATAVLYSNRSATRAAQEQYEKALRDATKCVTLRPDWSKGHSRRATALFGLGQYIEAEAACVAGLVLEASSKPLQTLLATCQQETCESLEVQQEMFRLRTQAKQDRKMEDLMKQFSGGGPGGPKVFNTNNMDFSGGGNPFANMGSSGGSNGLEGLFGGQNKKPKLSEQQMRGLARATVANGGRREMNSNSHNNNNSNNNDSENDTLPVIPPPSAAATKPSVSAAAVASTNGENEEEVLTDDDDSDDENGIAVKSIIE